MAETEHYKKILKLLNNNYPDQTVRFEALVDIDGRIFDELWQWIRDFSSERDNRNIFSIINIFNRVRAKTKTLGYTARGEVLRLSKIRADLLGLSSFNFNYFFTVRNIEKMLLPEEERVIFTEHHVFFEAANYKKGSLRELRNHSFAKVMIDIETHKKLHADIEKKFPENPPIVSEKTARNLLNILDSHLNVREEISEIGKIKILLHSLSLLIEESLKEYKETSTFENSEALVDAIKLERFVQAQSRWANKFKTDS